MTARAKTCPYTIEGIAAGPIAFFIHGWPDDASLWRNQIPALCKQYRCVLVTLPNFGERAVNAGGFDFPELIELLAATIRDVQPQGSVILIAHDWGTYMAYLLEKTHPHLVERIVAFDVGAHLGRPGAKVTAMIIAYQWALIGCWIIGGVIPPLGNLMARAVGGVIGVPPRQQATIRSRAGYAYFYLWSGLLLPWKRKNLLSRYRPQCPILYLYGEKKPFMFHSPKWLDIVAERGGYAEGIAGAGHWLMETHAELVNARVLEWLRGQAPSRPPDRPDARIPRRDDLNERRDLAG